MEALLNIFAVTVFAAIVFAIFAYTATVAYWTAVGVGQQMKDRRRRRRLQRELDNPYQATLANIKRLERELGEPPQ